MVCKKCGASLSEGSVFCSNCGAKAEITPTATEGNRWFTHAGNLDEQRTENSIEHANTTIERVCMTQTDLEPSTKNGFLPSKTTESKEFCQKCGAEISAGSVFCSKCGKSIPPDVEKAAQSSDRKCLLSQVLTKYQKPFMLSIVACCILALVVFGLHSLDFSEPCVPDKLIAEDVKGHFASFLDSCDMSVLSINVTDRKTDSDNKTDEVFVEMVSRNTACEVTKNFVMHYYKYDNGWELEGIQQSGEDIEVLNATISEAEARKALKKSQKHACLTVGELSFSGRDTQLANRKDVFNYTIAVKANYCVENYTASVTYLFKGYSWVLDTCQVTQGESTWDILGQWHYNAGDANIWVNIISQNQGKYEMEFSVQYNYSGWYNSGQRKISSSGTVEKYGFEDTDVDRNKYLKIELIGYNESGEYVDAGWIKVYPNSGLSWDEIGVTGGPFSLSSGAGIYNSENKRTRLADLFALDIEAFDYVDASVTDKDGKTYSGYFNLNSYIGMYRFDTEIRYDLNKEYSTFTGTYFCDPHNNDGDTIRVEIYCDNELVYTTGEMTPESPISNFTLDLTGVKELKIWARSDSREDLWDDNYHRPAIFLVDAYVE